jgi:tRNA pseudouridine13 synthase
MKPDPAAPERPAADVGTHVVPQAYITASVPAIGGTLKQRPEDFLVDEVPAYQPCGEGEHIYMLVQKKGLSTLELVDILARHFRVKRRDIGYAGLKDKHAITRQVVSVHVPGRKLEDFPSLRNDRVEVLWSDYHTNKLRPGHLKGNRFSIRVRGVRPEDARQALRVLRTLSETGVPNRVGEQRFGLLGNNHLIGRALVLGDFEGAVRELLGPSAQHPAINTEARQLFSEGRYAEAIPLYPAAARTEQRVLFRLSKGSGFKGAMLTLDEPILRYYLSAFQSAVFNATLDARIAQGTLSSLAPGDVAIIHHNHALFSVDDAVAADPETLRRLAAFEISPSGPMWTAGMKRAAGAVDEAEVGTLGTFGVTPEHLHAFEAASTFGMEGKRRPMRVPLIDPEVEGGLDEHGPYVRCAFELPRGSFATVVLREVMKPERSEGAGWEEDA